MVVILEVEFTLKNPPVEVESLPIADKIVGGENFLFLPSLSRLAFVLKNTIQVWDAKAAELLLKSKLPSPDPYYCTNPTNSAAGWLMTKKIDPVTAAVDRMMMTPTDGHDRRPPMLGPRR